jgi:hypothetical protein
MPRNPVSRAVYVSPAYTLLGPDEFRETPADALSGGLAGMVARIRPMFRVEGVVLVRGPFASGVDRGWQTFPGKPRVYVGDLDAIDPDDCPLIGPVNSDTLASFALFHDLTGVAYHRSGGVAGLSLLQQLHPLGKTAPIGWESDGPTSHAEEVAYAPADWQAPWAASCLTPETRMSMAGGRFRHGYDRRRAGLAAMNTVHVGRTALRHVSRKTFDPAVAGWWLCEVPAWNDPRMPDPAGYCGHDHAQGDVCVRWLTNPTIELLNQLAGEGVSAGVRIIHEAWISERSRLFLGWAETLNKAWLRATAMMDTVDLDGAPSSLAQDAKRARDAISDTYRQTPGMFGAPDSWVKREDWLAAKVAMERVTVWRTCWKVGKACDRWPAWIDGDTVYYHSDNEDAKAAVPDGMALGVGLGQWRTTTSKRVWA